MKQLIFFLKVTILNGEKNSLVDIEANAESLQKSGKLVEESSIFYDRTPAAKKEDKDKKDAKKEDKDKKELGDLNEEK